METGLEADLSEAEKELLRVRHVETRQQCITVMIVVKPRLQSVVTDLQPDVICNILAQCRYSVLLSSFTDIGDNTYRAKT